MVMMLIKIKINNKNKMGEIYQVIISWDTSIVIIQNKAFLARLGWRAEDCSILEFLVVELMEVLI